MTLAQIKAKQEAELHDGLCNVISIDIFSTWYAFGGMQRGLSIEEVLSMPAWLRQDFSFIVRRISEYRETADRQQETEDVFKQRMEERRKEKLMHKANDVHLQD